MNIEFKQSPSSLAIADLLWMLEKSEAAQALNLRVLQNRGPCQ